MKNIAVIGAGQAGLLIAHGLVLKDYGVTLFSNVTADDFLKTQRPTGTAARFNMSLDFERKLGLDFWEEDAPKGTGVHLTFSPSDNNRLLTLCGRIKKHFFAIDLRLQSHRWMNELEARGGKIVIENITIERLEEIAGDHDLTIVAAGRGEIHKLFKRDEERSTYVKPQRKLTMINVLGNEMGFEGVYGTPVKFNFFAKSGEAFWVPWLHKDHGHAWSMLFEAKEGSPIDRFDGVENGDQAVEIGKQLIKDMMPWDYEWCKNMRLADENSWLMGKFTPEIRQTVGTLPSGRHVMSLGDTTMSLDPIGGEGANNGNKMAKNLLECIIAHEDREFDAEWMQSTFEKFWDRHKWINTFNNILLEPLTKPGQELLIAQYGSTGAPDNDSPQQLIADAFMENFDDPATLTPAFLDMNIARDFIASVNHGKWRGIGVKGKVGIGKAQIKQLLLRKDPGHPSTVPFEVHPA